MWKKLVLGLVVLFVVAVGAVYYWSQHIFSSDFVRRAVESQLTDALGQPVRIGAIGARVFPRVTMALADVRIGDPARITARRLDVGTGLGALISRRIEHATVTLVGARVELPLPLFAMGASGGSSSEGAPIQIVSIDDITLEDLEIVSGGRTVTGDVELAMIDHGLTIRRAEFSADGAALAMTGRISDFSGPRGALQLTAPSLDILQLVAFASDFSAASAATGQTAPMRPGTAAGPDAAIDPTPMDLTVTIETSRALLGTLVLDALSGRAHVTPESVRLEPIAFGVFGGRANGTLTFALAGGPGFRVDASVKGMDLASFMAFAGQANLMTGTLTGRMTVSGRGTTASAVMSSTTGTARIDAANGTIRGLGLVRAVVLAGSGRGSSQAKLSEVSVVEPFTRLGTTLAIAGASATTKDLRFESKDLVVDAAGRLRLDGSDVNLSGRAQLGDELTRQAGQDLVRYTAEDGRVTLPVHITGPASNLSVRLDAAAVLQRAIINRATEEAKEAIRKGLGGMFKR